MNTKRQSKRNLFMKLIYTECFRKLGMSGHMMVPHKKIAKYRIIFFRLRLSFRKY